MNKPILFIFRTQDQILFAKRLSMILRSGLPIMEGLHMLADEAQTRSSVFLYKHLIGEVSRGRTLSSGLQKFERTFGTFCIHIIRVGEASGTLHHNLEYLADELKRKQALRRTVISALIYPALITVATVLITALLTMYIFPKIVPIFVSVKATVPLSTRMLIAISAFLSAWWIWLIVLFVALVVGFVFLMRIPRFHLVVDTILLHIPLFGSLSRYYNLANICRTVSLLLKSDIGILRSIDMVAASTRNLAYRRELKRAHDRLTKGQKISQQYNGNTLLFPRILMQMIAVGESTGNLSSTLSFLSDMYEEEMGDLTKNLTNVLEPVLMIVMGLIVGFIAISIITPIYSITQNLSPR